MTTRAQKALLTGQQNLPIVSSSNAIGPLSAASVNTSSVASAIPPPPLYEITYTPRIDEFELNRSGDFRSVVDFDVKLIQNPKQKKNINGYIFQLIIKETNAEGSNLTEDEYTKIEEARSKGTPYVPPAKTILNTSDSIERYTNGQVKYMCQNYIEFFEIKNGICLDDKHPSKRVIVGDSFSNGSISRYAIDDSPLTDDNEAVSQGTIIHIGLSVFIPDSPFLTDIRRNYNWDPNDALPANGLYCLFLPGNEHVWEEILQNKASIITMHKVLHAWKFIQKDINNDTSFVENFSVVPLSEAIELGTQYDTSKIMNESRQEVNTLITNLISQPPPKPGGGKRKTQKTKKNKKYKKQKNTKNKKQKTKKYYKKYYKK
jgi:hypothetical protein